MCSAPLLAVLSLIRHLYLCQSSSPDAGLTPISQDILITGAFRSPCFGLLAVVDFGDIPWPTIGHYPTTAFKIINFPKAK